LFEKFFELMDSYMEAGQIGEEAISKIVMFHKSARISKIS
jgi:hypothetical protein